MDNGGSPRRSVAQGPRASVNMGPRKSVSGPRASMNLGPRKSVTGSPDAAPAPAPGPRKSIMRKRSVLAEAAAPEPEPEVEEGYEEEESFLDSLVKMVGGSVGPDDEMMPKREVEAILKDKVEEQDGRIQKVQDKLGELLSELEEAEGADAQRCVDLVASAQLACRAAMESNNKAAVLTTRMVAPKSRLPVIDFSKTKPGADSKLKKQKEGDNDTMERITVLGTAAGELYKIAFGTMLVVFVPHSVEGHDEYSIEAALKPTTPFGMFTLAVNGAGLVALLILYAAELMRENWCIENLDIDPSMPDDNVNNLPEEVKKQLRKWNKRYARSTHLAIFVSFLNVVVSGIYLAMHYDSPITVTTGVNLLLMLATKLNKCLTSQSQGEGLNSRSAYMIECTAFNALDNDVKHLYPDEGADQGFDRFHDD